MTSHSRPACSIVIRSYNEEQHIGRLLAGIMHQSISDVEIVLVDSGSTDATVEIATRFPVQIVTIHPEEFTFGRSLNLGCAQAQGEILVFASAHVYPLYADWLEKLIAPFIDPSIALAYGRQRGNEKTKFSEEQQFAKMFPADSSIPQNHPLCNNANAAIRRDLWQQRSFDESLSGLEDLEWATWVISEGHKLAYCAEAEVVHVHDESPRQVFHRYEREAIGLSRIRPEETFRFIDFFRLYLSNVGSDLRLAMKDRVFLKHLWSILWFRWMQFMGTYAGFAHMGPVTDEVIQAFYYPRRDRSKGSEGMRDASPIDYSEISFTPDLKGGSDERR